MKLEFKSEKIGLLLIAGIAIIAFSYPMENLVKQTSVQSESVVQETLTESTNSYEQRLSQILSKVEGVGQVEVMVTVKTASEKESNEGETVLPTIEGVVVIAQGADNIKVKTQIYETVHALFAVDLHKIKVLKGDF